MIKWSPPVLLMTILTLNAYAQNSHSKATILFVGMKHFELFDDIYSPKRQKEIAEIVTLLKKFNPTKITCERQFVDKETFEIYSKYLKGDYELSIHESNQIGFRLAKELHLEKVYPVDYRTEATLPSIDSSAKANNQEVFLRRLIDGFDRIGTPSDDMIKTSSILQVLRAVNAESILEQVDRVQLSSYVHIHNDKDYIGTDHLTEWYKRNLRIYTNITRIIDSKNDRVLVLIGAAHVNVLRWFALGSGEYNVEKADEHLK
ncbi:MAG: DUF5694 domain-containing protein [bacterium]